MEHLIKGMKIHVQQKEFWLLQSYQLARFIKWITTHIVVMVSIFLIIFFLDNGLREILQNVDVSIEQITKVRQPIRSTFILVGVCMIMAYSMGRATLSLFSDESDDENLFVKKILYAIWNLFLVVISLDILRIASFEDAVIWVEQILVKVVFIGFVGCMLAFLFQKLFLWWLNRNVFVQSMHDFKKIKNIDGEQIHANPSEFIQVKDQWEKYIYLKNNALCDEFVYRSNDNGMNTRKVFLLYEIKYISTSILITICQESVSVRKILKQEHKIEEGV